MLLPSLDMLQSYSLSSLHEDFIVVTYFLLITQEQENKARAEKGEARLPDEDLNKLFKPPTVPPRLEGLLSSGQMKIYCTEINKLASQTFGKLFLADALQSNPSLS